MFLLFIHCNGNSVYIFLFWELRGLSPNFHIHVSVSNLYIPRIGPHISSSRKGRPIVEIYNSLTDTWTWKLGLRPRYSFSGNICFKFSAFCLAVYGAGRIDYEAGKSISRDIGRGGPWKLRLCWPKKVEKWICPPLKSLNVKLCKVHKIRLQYIKGRGGGEQKGSQNIKR